MMEIESPFYLSFIQKSDFKIVKFFIFCNLRYKEEMNGGHDFARGMYRPWRITSGSTRRLLMIPVLY